MILCLGPQRPRCRIRFASLAASNCGSTSRFQGCASGQRSGPPTGYGIFVFQQLGDPVTEPVRWVSIFRTGGQVRDVARRIRMGPRAREGSTIWPFCVISWVPAVTSLRAAERAGSRSSRQFTGSTNFAASLGQMLLKASRLFRSCSMAVSNCWSTGRTFCRRQRSEHHFTWSQFLAHFFRHWMVRPHAWQVFSSSGIIHSRHKTHASDLGRNAVGEDAVGLLQRTKRAGGVSRNGPGSEQHTRKENIADDRISPKWHTSTQ